MKRLLRYSNGDTYVDDPRLSIIPRAEPVEVIDISEATEEELKELKRNPRNTALVKKIKDKSQGKVDGKKNNQIE